MARFALVDPRSGEVKEISAREFPVAPPLIWVADPADSITTENRWDGTRIIDPPPRPSETAQTFDQDKRLKAIVTWVAQKHSVPYVVAANEINAILAGL